MLKLMFKWTKDFEQDRNKYEEMLDSYRNKLVVLKSSKELKTKLIGMVRI